MKRETKNKLLAGVATAGIIGYICASVLAGAMAGGEYGVTIFFMFYFVPFGIVILTYFLIWLYKGMLEWIEGPEGVTEYLLGPPPESRESQLKQTLSNETAKPAPAEKGDTGGHHA